MELRAPTREDLEEVRKWRSNCRHVLRTPYLQTKEMQENFYDEVVCKSKNSRWWSVYNSQGLVGFTGLSNIEWENGLAEISLIIDPLYHGQGYGRRIVELVLSEGFYNMGLKTIYGECYQCNPAIEFWRKLTEEHGGYYTMIPRRKLWQGQLYDALHFSVWKGVN